MVAYARLQHPANLWVKLCVLPQEGSSMTAARGLHTLKIIYPSYHLFFPPYHHKISSEEHRCIQQLLAC